MTDAGFAAFEAGWRRGQPQLLLDRRVSDLDTPVSAYLKLAAGRAHSFLLESVEGGEQLGRYSMIGFDPDAIWRADGARARINRRAADEPEAFVDEADSPLESLKAFIDESRFETPAGAPPMAAGVFGYLGYDMARQMERLPARPRSAFEAPDALFIRPRMIAVFDNVKQEITLATTVRPVAGVSAREAFDDSRARLDAAALRLAAPIERAAMARATAPETPAPHVSNTASEEFRAMVAAAQDHIRAGDIFQVVLSQRFETPFARPPFDLYRALRRINPSPFLFFLDFGELALVGSSPEILVRVRNGDVTIRPIAGTRPRGASPQEDALLAEDLLADPKERAEHLMLLDLGRNDVARASDVGSVRVSEQFVIERYSHVMHIVSNVVGRLRADRHPLDAVAAGFPAGTVTGAPKIRAMEIIDSLEKDGRGPYGGAIGYFSADGNVDTCIALRTGVISRGVLRVQAGAGVVADSDPAREDEECRNKARALFVAAAAANADNA